jgi:hypothetical protein
VHGSHQPAEPFVALTDVAKSHPKSRELRMIAWEVLAALSDETPIRGLAFDRLSAAEVEGLRDSHRLQNEADVWRVFVVHSGGWRGYLLRSLEEGYLRSRLASMLDDVVHDESS